MEKWQNRQDQGWVQENREAGKLFLWKCNYDIIIIIERINELLSISLAAARCLDLQCK